MSNVHVSKMSGKLAGIPAVNTNTVTNPFCIKEAARPDASLICTHCYSHTMLNSYRKSCQPAFQRNSDLLASDADVVPPTFNAHSVRFNGHGELINVQHYKNLIKIALANPHTMFGLWTKRVDIVRGIDKPDNLLLIYSNPRIDAVMDKPPRGFDRVFNNVSKQYTGEANCTGQKCIDCLLCYRSDTTKVIIEHVK